jgi:1,2-diacylglycerol 3-beta-galactosyltransferase
METTKTNKPTVLFLFSDTGGGHRSAAEAIIEALENESGGALRTEMVDIFKDYAPPPLNYLPALYPTMVRAPRAWGLGYRLSNGERQTNMLVSSFWPYVRRPAHQLIEQHPCDIIVSVHPVANGPVLRAMPEKHPPYITVVTDLVTTHAMWYHPMTDLCLVPTEAARQRALAFGLKSEQVRVVGLPVAERFCQPPGEKNCLRIKLGWPVDRPLVLLVGGGEGMGPLESMAQAINASCPSATLVVVTGRNQDLKARLEASPWSIPTFIYGFVREMPAFMHAADVLVTKAGPGTISEALIAGLPMLLYSRLPGQEDGNVAYVVSEGAGIWAPQPNQIVSALNDWLNNPEKRLRVSAACKRLARPNAAREIAKILIEKLNHKVELKKIL